MARVVARSYTEPKVQSPSIRCLFNGLMGHSQIWKRQLITKLTMIIGGHFHASRSRRGRRWKSGFTGTGRIPADRDSPGRIYQKGILPTLAHESAFKASKMPGAWCPGRLFELERAHGGHLATTFPACWVGLWAIWPLKLAPRVPGDREMSWTMLPTAQRQSPPGKTQKSQ